MNNVTEDSLYSSSFCVYALSVQRTGLSRSWEVVIGQRHLPVEKIFQCRDSGFIVLGSMLNVMGASVCVHLMYE